MKQIQWVPFSAERLAEWEVSDAFVAFVDGEEIGSVYKLVPSYEDLAYGQIFGQRIGVCWGIDKAKACVELHFKELMSGAPSDFWGRT